MKLLPHCAATPGWFWREPLLVRKSLANKLIPIWRMLSIQQKQAFLPVHNPQPLSNPAVGPSDISSSRHFHLGYDPSEKIRCSFLLLLPFLVHVECLSSFLPSNATHFQVWPFPSLPFDVCLVTFKQDVSFSLVSVKLLTLVLLATSITFDLTFVRHFICPILLFLYTQLTLGFILSFTLGKLSFCSVEDPGIWQN